jgi:diacylglycerol kinase (ATP)
MDAAVSVPARRVAVIAHRKKSIGGGLEELRKLIADEGFDDPIWYEVSKSRKARKRARHALKDGADLVLVWGGDGMVQQCVDALAGSHAAVAVIPAGTANLFAGNLGIPTDLPEAVRIAFHGPRRRLDLGKLNREHFAVMAGAGFDGQLINDADRGLKDRAGRLAYVLTGLRHVRDKQVPTKIRVDGRKWFDGPATCVLFGNVGTITGGIRAFDDARPDDGYLDVGVAGARGALQWARTLGRVAAGRSERSPFVEMTQGRVIDVKFGRAARVRARRRGAGFQQAVEGGCSAGGAHLLCARGITGAVRGSTWVLRNANSGGLANMSFNYGLSIDYPIPGD